MENRIPYERKTQLGSQSGFLAGKSGWYSYTGLGTSLKRSLLFILFHTLLISRFVSGVHKKEKLFTVSDTCSSCGICSESYRQTISKWWIIIRSGNISVSSVVGAFTSVPSMQYRQGRKQQVGHNTKTRMFLCQNYDITDRQRPKNQIILRWKWNEIRTFHMLIRRNIHEITPYRVFVSSP